jgi:hypothetical protein
MEEWPVSLSADGFDVLYCLFREHNRGTYYRTSGSGRGAVVTSHLPKARVDHR